MYWSGGNFNHVKNSEDCCGCHSKVTESDDSEYFAPKQLKKMDIYLYYVSVAVPNDRSSYSNSLEFTQSQQSVEHLGQW
jgi:hypothetical protein